MSLTGSLLTSLAGGAAGELAGVLTAGLAPGAGVILTCEGPGRGRPGVVLTPGAPAHHPRL